MMEVDRFKRIFDDFPELSELLCLRQKLNNKKVKTKEETEQLASVCKKLEKIFKEVEGEIHEFPFNIPLAIITARNIGINISSYEIDGDSLLMYIDEVDNIWKRLGQLLNIFYNNVFCKESNEISRMRIFLKDINFDSKILTMEVKDIIDFMTDRVSVSDFSRKCSVV
jgi:hypothetical protein